MRPSTGKVPKHIGVILDGNRRLAKRLMIKPWKGHEWGAKKIQELLLWAKELGVKELTLYCFSVENFNRPKDEFNYLMNLFRREFRRLYDEKKMEEEQVRVNVIGRIWMFPKDIQEIMHKVMEKTKNYKRYILNFAAAYGGRAEIVDAVKKISEQVKQGKLDIDKINEQVFEKNLYMADKPDLIIRTGAVTRTSNFLPFQSAYSEYIFIDKMWPEFEKEDFVACVEEFKKRERRFGK